MAATLIDLTRLKEALAFREDGFTPWDEEKELFIAAARAYLEVAQRESPVVGPDYEAALSDEAACIAEDKEVERIVNMSEDELIAEAGGRENYERGVAESKRCIDIAMVRFHITDTLLTQGIKAANFTEISKPR